MNITPFLQDGVIRIACKTCGCHLSLKHKTLIEFVEIQGEWITACPMCKSTLVFTPAVDTFYGVEVGDQEAAG